MAVAGSKGIMTSAKAFTSKYANKTAALSKKHLPASVHNAGSKGVNWVKQNPMYATAGAGGAGLAGGAMLG